MQTLRGTHASPKFWTTPGRRRFQRQTANATNLPKFLAPRLAMKTLRGTHASLKFLLPKFSRTTPGGRRFQRQTANATNLPKFWAPRCLVVKTWRLCFARISVPKIFADHFWRKKVQKNTKEQQSSEETLRTQQHTYVHTYILTYVHTYIHIYIYISSLFLGTCSAKQMMVGCGASEAIAHPRSREKGRLADSKNLRPYLCTWFCDNTLADEPKEKRRPSCTAHRPLGEPL